MSSNEEQTGRDLRTGYASSQPYQYAMHGINPPYQAVPAGGVPAAEVHHHEEGSGNVVKDGEREKEEDEDGIPLPGKGPGGVQQKNFAVSLNQ